MKEADFFGIAIPQPEATFSIDDLNKAVDEMNSIRDKAEAGWREFFKANNVDYESHCLAIPEMLREPWMVMPKQEGKITFSRYIEKPVFFRPLESLLINNLSNYRR